MTKRLSGLLLSLLLIGFPTFALAQESVGSPNDKSCAPGSNNANVPGTVVGSKMMNVRVTTSRTPNLKTDDVGGVPLGACNSGLDVAKKAFDQLCAAAVSKGYICSHICGTAGIGPGCCPLAVLTDSTFVECTAPPRGGITISRIAGETNVRVAEILPNQLNAVNFNTNAGNTLSNDPLPQYLTRVRNLAGSGVNGVVTWRFKIQGHQGQDPIVTVDTTGKTDEQIHNEIADKFNALTEVGLTAIVHNRTEARLHSHVPETFDGYFVRVPNATAQGVTEIFVTAQENQVVIAEDNAGQRPAIPTLSTLGMAVLITLLMLGAWFVYRRQRMQQA